MAGRSAVLAISIIADSKQARRELDSTGRSVGKFQSGLSKATVPAAAVVGALGLVGKAALDSASELQQSTGAVQSVFGKYAQAIIGPAKQAAQAVGLSQSAFQTQAVLLGSQLKNLGQPMAQVSGTTNDLIKKAADLAATFGGPTSDAVEAISSLMRGESDPIERYGVSINQAAIAAYEAAHGLNTSTTAAAKNSKRQAILALLYKQTTAATGQFAREATSAAGAQEISNAKFENTKAALGTKLLPVYAKFKTILASVFGWVTKNSDIVFTLAGVLGGAAVAVLAINAGVKAWTATTKAFTAVQKVLNFVLGMNPILRIVIIIAALVAGLIIAYKKSETFRNIVNGAFKAVMKVVTPIVDFFAKTIPNAIKTLLSKAHDIWNDIVAFFKKWGPIALQVLFPFIGIVVQIKKHWSEIVGFFKNLFGDVLGWVKDFVGNIVDAIASLPGKIARFFGSMARTGKDWIGSFFNGILDGLKAAGSWVVNAAKTVVNAIISGLNNFLNLPWTISVHIPIPLAPDIDLGPYTIMPSIPLWSAAARPAVLDPDSLRPGFTLFAAAGSWPAQLSMPAGQRDRTTVQVVKVYFQGLVTDPDGVARQIEDVLDRRAARVSARSTRFQVA